MAQTTYQVTLSANGRHTITVTSDDEAAIEAAVSWAAHLYARLARPSTARRGSVADEDIDLDDEPAPECGVHHTPMVRVQGRRGAFWSCHQRMPDGSFCSYRPGRQ